MAHAGGTATSDATARAAERNLVALEAVLVWGMVGLLGNEKRECHTAIIGYRSARMKTGGDLASNPLRESPPIGMKGGLRQSGADGYAVAFGIVPGG
jgi:hypothetical protein